MNPSFRLFPESASTFSDRVDALFAFETSVAFFFTLLICALILTFAIRYRRGSPTPRTNKLMNVGLEVAWIVVPLALTIVMFAGGAMLYRDMSVPPADALTIDVVGKQWMWKAQHPNGRGEINELHVPIGQPVRLRMISQDVIHSFYIPAFRVKQDVLPGRYTGLWFEANLKGRFHLFCAEYCGAEHSQMRGTVTVMDDDAYSDWLAGGAADSPAQAGEKLFARFRCRGCHPGTGPSLTGLFGKTVALEGDDTITADADYLRTAILNPAKHVVAGYRPTMPPFEGQLDEFQVMQLIAYLKSLAPTQTTGDAP